MTEEKDLKLITKRLVLRSYKEEDWKTAHDYGSIPEFSKYEVWGPSTEEDSKNFIRDCKAREKKSPSYEYDFAVCLAETGYHIGGCRVSLEAGALSKVASLGWAINPKYQSQGFATEAARALLKFAFQDLQVLVAYATCDVRNTPSYKVMEKIGMKRVGCLENRKAKDGLTSQYRYEIYQESLMT